MNFQLKESLSLHFNKFEFPYTNDVSFGLIVIGPLVVEKKAKCKTFTDRQTKVGQKVNRIAILSSSELIMPVNINKMLS